MFTAINTTAALTEDFEPHQTQMMHPQAPHIMLYISLKCKTSCLLPSVIPTQNNYLFNTHIITNKVL